MTSFGSYLCAGLLVGAASFAVGSQALSDGIDAFEQRHWPEAMKDFLAALEKDPANAKAHAYINLIAQQIDIEHRAAVQKDRLAILTDASKRLEANHLDTSPVDDAIQNTRLVEIRAKENRWHSLCEQARTERDLGHLLSADDLILQVLSENSSYAEAQQALSDMQSSLRDALDHGAWLSMEERYAYEGFYSYSQADYAAAEAAWLKLHTLVGQSYSKTEAAKRLQAFHLAAYEQIAQTHVEEEQREAALKALFQKGLALYDARHFVEALDVFRQLAIQEPEFPQLGSYLVLAEGAAEKDRARRLGEEKRQQIARLLQKGIDEMEHERYPPARKAFEQALRQDPSYSQARTYLAMVEAEMQRQHDPKAAQMHYDAGLIAYASGRLDEAMREWRLALKLNPQHEKAPIALNKVQRELALSNNTP